MGDQSFRALVYSLVIHGLLLWLALHLPSQVETPDPEQPLEITIRDAGQRRGFVMETEEREADLADQLKTKADYLSRFTKRVKEQVRARFSGETKNRPGQEPTDADEMRAQGPSGVGADATRGRELILPGIGPGATGGPGAKPFGRQVVVGASTSGEYIPGVKEGAFTALNTDRFTYYTFFARVNEQVRSRWIRNLREYAGGLAREEYAELASRERITEIDVQLDPSGAFVRAVVLRSSGYRDLDRTATEAFREAAPFPNPPVEMKENDGLIHLRYGFVLQWSPNQLTLSR